jgi:hypothetical protein
MTLNRAWISGPTFGNVGPVLKCQLGGTYFIRVDATIDWTVREAVRAKLRVMVKRIVRKYGYPPDKQEKATITVRNRRS